MSETATPDLAAMARDVLDVVARDADVEPWVLHVEGWEVHVGAGHPQLGTGRDRRVPVDPRV